MKGTSRHTPHQEKLLGDAGSAGIPQPPQSCTDVPTRAMQFFIPNTEVAMNTQQYALIETRPMRGVVGGTTLSRLIMRNTMPLPQHDVDCRALTAFQAWQDADLEVAFNTSIPVCPWGIPPGGTRAVIALVTATIVPSHDARGTPHGSRMAQGAMYP
jgi:hypothetical protein